MNPWLPRPCRSQNPDRPEDFSTTLLRISGFPAFAAVSPFVSAPENILLDGPYYGWLIWLQRQLFLLLQRPVLLQKGGALGGLAGVALEEFRKSFYNELFRKGALGLLRAVHDGAGRNIETTNLALFHDSSDNGTNEAETLLLFSDLGSQCLEFGFGLHPFLYEAGKLLDSRFFTHCYYIVAGTLGPA